MNISDEISEVCKSQHKFNSSVLPPQVCPYCMKCPIGTIVVGINNPSFRQDGPLPISENDQASVREWFVKAKANLYAL